MVEYGYICNLLIFATLLVLTKGQVPPKSTTNDGDYNTLHRDGSYEFGYNNNDEGGSYHISQANRANVVRGRFGSRDPSSGGIKETIYTAGPRGFRARGPNIHRKMDLDQRPRGPIGNKDDPNFDPNEDPSYSFGFKTPTYEKQEAANRRGDVSGRYSYVDDIGERHNVEYIAGKDTGFHVKTAYPDSSPGSAGPLYFNGPLVRGEKKPRGHTSIQRGLDGSYKFISAGPDQRRTESSDANGNVRGSYTFLDDKGVQRTVHYIAGPGIGYRVIKNSKDPYIPAFFPSLPDYRDPNLNKPYPDEFITDNSFPNKDDNYDDLFGGPGGSAASGHVKPPANGNRKPPSKDKDKDDGNDDLFDFDKDQGAKPTKPGTIDSAFSGQNQGTVIHDDDDIFGKPFKGDDGFNKIPSSVDNNLNSHDAGTDEDDDIFGPRPGRPSNRPTDRPSSGSGGSGRPTRPNRPNRPNRPRPTDSSRPEYGATKPGTTTSTHGRPDSSETTKPDLPTTRPSYKPTRRPSGRPTRPSTKPVQPGYDSGRPEQSGSGSGRPGYDSGRPDQSGDGGGRPDQSGYGGGRPNQSGYGGGRPNQSGGSGGRPTQSGQGGGRPDQSGYGGGRPDQSGGSGGRPIQSSGRPDKPSYGGGRPTTKPRPSNGNANTYDEDDDIFGPKPSGSGYGSQKPSSGSTPFEEHPTKPTEYGPDSPIGPPIDINPTSTGGGFLDHDDHDDHDKGSKGPSDGSQIAISGGKGKHRGGTIFRNLGEESISFPPGASVRAHVQSIDIIPIGSKSRTPGEAVEAELKKHGSR